MKVALLAGGLGTRLSEETVVRPKPLVEIGGHPIMWHIMKTYAHYGLKDFVVIGGYKVQMIREYFMRYQSGTTDFTIDLKSGRIEWLGEVRRTDPKNLAVFTDDGHRSLVIMVADEIDHSLGLFVTVGAGV